jgi:phospholipase A1
MAISKPDGHPHPDDCRKRHLTALYQGLVWDDKLVSTCFQATVFAGRPFRHIFFRLLGGDDGEVLELDTLETQPLGPRVALSLDSLVQRVDRPVELTLGVFNSAAPDEAERAGEIAGVIVLEQVDENPKIQPIAVSETPISYRGPPIDRLAILLSPVERAGLYRLRFEGIPAAANTAPFAVSRV